MAHGMRTHSSEADALGEKYVAKAIPQSLLWGGPYHRSILRGNDPPGEIFMEEGSHVYQPSHMVIVDGVRLRMFRHDPACCDLAGGEVIDEEEPPAA